MKQLWNKMLGKGWYGLQSTNNVYTNALMRLGYLSQKPNFTTSTKDKNRANDVMANLLQNIPQAEVATLPANQITTLVELTAAIQAVMALANPQQQNAPATQAVATFATTYGNFFGLAQANGVNGYGAVPNVAPVAQPPTVVPTAYGVMPSQPGTNNVAPVAGYGQTPNGPLLMPAAANNYGNVPQAQAGQQQAMHNADGYGFAPGKGKS